jgi:ferritin-like metal-binding protein YciE
MANPKQRDRTLRDLFIARLTDVYDSEKQLIKALPDMAAAAQNPKLRAAFTEHLAATQGQLQLLEQVFGLLDLKAKGTRCDGIAGIIDEARDAIDGMTPSPVRDAALAASGRLAVHYEIATYGDLLAIGDALGHSNVSKRLGKILVQQDATEKRMSELGLAALKLAQEEMPVEA